MIVSQIVDYLEDLFPPSIQEEYDNCGLLIGNKLDNVDAALVCLEITPDVIEEAKKSGCQMIISHHPLIFNGLKRLTGQNDTQRMVEDAIISRLNIYALHTNLDNSAQGLNQDLCRRLGVVNPTVLQPKSSMLRKLVTFCPISHAERVRQSLFDAGAGKIGNYDSCSFTSDGTGTFRPLDEANPFVGVRGELHSEPEVKIEAIYPSYLELGILKSLFAAHPYEEVAYDILLLGNVAPYAGSGMIGTLEQPTIARQFLQMIKEKLSIHCLRYSGNDSRMIKKVALCGGAGNFLIPDALKAGADLFLTGDLKYHDFFVGEQHMVLADIGHYESEQYSINLIIDCLNRKFPTFAALKTNVITNPILYI